MPVERQAATAALRAVLDAPDVVPLRAATMAAMALYGIEACFFLAPLVDDPRVGRIMTNIGVSRIWARYYRAWLHLCNPLPRVALGTTLAFAWPRDLDMDDLPYVERRYLEIAAQHGLARGIATICYGPNGRAGFLGALWPLQTDPPDEVVLAVHQIGQLSFSRYCQIMREDYAVEPLSNREPEVLEWMCRGKSNPVIAEIIGVSRSSVTPTSAASSRNWA